MADQSKQEGNVQTDAELQEGLHYIGIISYLVEKNNPGDKQEIRDFLTSRRNRSNAALAAKAAIKMAPRLALDAALRPLTEEELNQILNERLQVYWISCLAYFTNPDVDSVPFLTQVAKDPDFMENIVELAEHTCPCSEVTKDISLLKKEDWYHFAWARLLGTTADNPSTQALDYELLAQRIDLLRDIFHLFGTGELAVLVQDSIKQADIQQLIDLGKKELQKAKQQQNEELEKRNQENTNLKNERDRLTQERDRIQHEQIKLREELEKIKQQRDLLAQQNNELKQQSLKTKTATKEADPKGYYEILGIDPSLAQSLSEEKFNTLLTGTYRVYSKIYHTDLGGNKDKMKRLNLAHEFLLDPQKRRTYGK